MSHKQFRNGPQFFKGVLYYFCRSVVAKCFPKSAHVAHLRGNRKDYEATVKNFVFDAYFRQIRDANWRSEQKKQKALDAERRHDHRRREDSEELEERVAVRRFAAA